MEKVIEKLITNFDTNILDYEKKNIQAALYSTAIKVKNTNKDNTIFRLIRNHYEKLKPKIEYIGGPFVFIHLYSKKYDMNIHLFGERHSTEVDCPDNFADNFDFVEDYLKRLVENTDVFLDIYFEFPGFIDYEYKSNDLMVDQRMQELFKNFYKCVQTSSRYYPSCKLSRIHYIDIRNFDNENVERSELSWYQSILSESLSDESNLTNIKNNFERFIRFLISLRNPNIEQYKNYMKEQLQKSKHLMKEISKSYLKDDIYNYLENKIIEIALQHKDSINIICDNIFALYNVLPKVNVDIMPLILKKYLDLLIYIININAIIIDGYALCRMFKKFKVEKLDQPEKPHNIIHYAGALHTRNVFEFLILKGFELIENSGSFDMAEFKNCVNMSQIKQPIVNYEVLENKNFVKKRKYLLPNDLKPIDFWNLTKLEEFINDKFGFVPHIEFKNLEDKLDRLQDFVLKNYDSDTRKLVLEKFKDARDIYSKIVKEYFKPGEITIEELKDENKLISYLTKKLGGKPKVTGNKKQRIKKLQNMILNEYDDYIAELIRDNLEM